MKILVKENKQNDVHNISYYFKNDNGILNLYQAESGDLIFSACSYPNYHRKLDFEISKDEYYQLYMFLNDSLNKMKNKKDSDILFEKGFFSWQSDGPVCNYLNILEIKDTVILEMINNTKENQFSVEVNTDRSRYNDFRLDMIDLYTGLKEILNKPQISMEEYLYHEDKKLVKKKD